MKNYKIKLQKEDHLRTKGLSISDYENVVSRFFADGCPEGDYNRKKFFDFDFFGWGINGIAFHDNPLCFEGREFSFNQIMEKETGDDWYERGELPPVGSFCECNYSNEGDWAKGKIAAHVFSDETGTQAIFQGEDFWCARGAFSKSFRPIKSDREKAIDAALLLDPFVPNTQLGMLSRHDFCGVLYDAGLLRAREQK